jgi:hypothetical protein
VLLFATPAVHVCDCIRIACTAPCRLNNMGVSLERVDSEHMITEPTSYRARNTCAHRALITSIRSAGEISIHTHRLRFLILAKTVISHNGN